MVTIGLPEKLLQNLDDKGELDTYEFAVLINEDHQKVVGAVKCLQALDGIITVEPKSSVKWVLTEEGKHVTEVGSHEALAYEAIPPEGITKDELSKNVPSTVHSIGLSKAMAHGWILIEKTDGKAILRRKVESIKDVVRERLLAFATNPDGIDTRVKNEYKKRKLIQEVTTKSFKLGKGENFSLRVSKPETDLTPEMIASGSWKNLDFKPYNFNARGVPPPCGVLHPLLKVRSEFRQIFLEMGFTEMPTNNYVESSFWNFDALFQPQQHPARDAHDTFFIAAPKETKTFPLSYLEKVKQVHSSGGFGSQGYGYDWKIEEAQKNLLRTHTTAVSARMLYKLAQDGFRPAKYFSIDRVFRNETLDATHLAEFHQVEGVIADYKLSLGDLIGTLNEFFSKLGLSNLTFKPAYNPYTEPSMEIFSFHPGLNKHIEVGNSGIFRPEMLLPMGLPEDVNVIAWGLSLERPTMIKYGINNIRTLVGPKVDMEMVHASPLCRLDKVEVVKNSPKLESLIERIEGAILHLEGMDCSDVCNLKQSSQKIEQMISTPQMSSQVQKKESETVESFEKEQIKPVVVAEEIEIVADPRYPPWAVMALLKLLANKIRGSISTDPTVESVPTAVNSLMEKMLKSNSSDKEEFKINFIWKNSNVPLIKLKDINVVIFGEVNIVRYLALWVERDTNLPMIYKKPDDIEISVIDYWLDLIHSSLVYGNNAKRDAAVKKLDKLLMKNLWIVGFKPTVADLCLWSAVRNMPELSTTLTLWLEVCDETELFILN